ncbi:MAG: tyrosine-type recombinase/integrase, partial [Synergistaceae bacterium]|nr:tyrosine-type recombinase/integrase [Synergistaceae bacterium]
LTTRTISGIAKRTMRQAGFDSPRLSAHSLRHSAVTLSLLAGADLAEVQAFARHSNISTTQIYSHAVDRINSMCENAISDAIFS